MKRAVSVSLGSSKRDKSVKVNLNGQEILVERIGTDGDIEKARQMYLDLDGKVAARLRVRNAVGRRGQLRIRQQPTQRALLREARRPEGLVLPPRSGLLRQRDDVGDRQLRSGAAPRRPG